MIAMSSDAPTEPTVDTAYDLLNCMEQGKCGELKYLNDNSVKVDLAQEIPLENARKFTDPETGDLILKNVRILSPGVRNGYDYPRDVVSATKHYKGMKELSESKAPFVVPHSSNPLEQIGRTENMRYDRSEDSIVGDIRIYRDDDLPSAKAAIALINRETGFLSVSTRLKAEPVYSEGHKPGVRNLRLIHVAWVDVGADPTAGIPMSNSETTLDNLLPLSNNGSWNGSGAESRVWEWANQSASKAKAAYFWSADNPTTQSDLKLPFADIVDGKLTAVKAGVQAAYGAMRGSHGNTPSIPSGDSAGVLSKIHSYYTAFGLDWPLDKESADDTATQDTTQSDESATEQHTQNSIEERGQQMAKKDEKPVEDKPEPVENAEEPVKDEPTTAPIDNATPTPTLTMTQDEFDNALQAKLDAALAEHDALMQAAYVKRGIVEELMKLDPESTEKFLYSLDEEQLTEYRKTVERYQTTATHNEQVIAELKRAFPAADLGEKPSAFAGRLPQGVDMAKLEEIYPSKTKEQLRKEQIIAQMAQGGINRGGQ